MPHCTDAFLVGLDHQLPTDPTVAYLGKPPIVGCNNLVCLSCRELVKHADARSTTRAYVPPREDMEQLYDSRDPGSSPLLDGSPMNAKARTYFCKCYWYAVELGGAKPIKFLNDNDWACGGH